MCVYLYVFVFSHFCCFVVDRECVAGFHLSVLLVVCVFVVCCCCFAGGGGDFAWRASRKWQARASSHSAHLSLLFAVDLFSSLLG